ncbi:hypothetical protein ACB092_09G116700 [Castanea dentata]
MDNVIHFNTSTQKQRWKAIHYILGNKTFEKLAAMSLIANLVVYMHTKYNMDNVHLANAFNMWSGFTNVLPLLGAFIADTYLGRFHTIVFGTGALLLGMGIMALTAGMPRLRPSSCIDKSNCPRPQSWQLAILPGLDTRTEEGRAQLESFCNWWYFLFSWLLGFVIPTCCLALSFTIFLLGRNTYICVKPNGSIFAEMAKVIIAAYRKNHSTKGQPSPQSFYDPLIIESEDSETHRTMLGYTDTFKFLDKAAAITDPSELDNQGKPKNGWILCSLQQVEELKCMIGVLPVWLSGIRCFLAMTQMSSFGILQAIQMKRLVGPHFQIPPAWMGLKPMIALSTWTCIYEGVYVPLMQKRAKKNKRLTMEQRIMIGIVMAILCMMSPITMALLVPKFALSGWIEAFAAIAMMESLTTQCPESMKTFGGAVFFLGLSLASYLSTILVSIIYKVTGLNGKFPRLDGNDLNKNRLDFFYFTIAALSALNLLYFYVFARRYLRYSEPQKS